MLSARPSCLFMLCGCISISIASLMRRYTSFFDTVTEWPCLANNHVYSSSSPNSPCSYAQLYALAAGLPTPYLNHSIHCTTPKTHTHKHTHKHIHTHCPAFILLSLPVHTLARHHTRLHCTFSASLISFRCTNFLDA